MNKGNVLFAGIAVLTMGLLLGLPIPSVAGTFWTDAFSYASQSNFEAVWDSSCPGNSSLMGPSANYFKNPSYSLRSVMNGGVNTCYVNRFHQPTNDVWLRWWYRTYAGWVPDPTTGSKQMYNKAIGTFLMVWHEHPNSNEMGAIAYTGASTPTYCASTNRNDTACNYYANMAHINVNDANWHCIETHANLGGNVANKGTIEIWVDNKQVLGYYNVTVAVEAGSWQEITHYAQQGTGTRYIDDLAVGDTRIGCGSVSEGTPPQAPTGLSVQ